jgi:hypothetical protein
VIQIHYGLAFGDSRFPAALQARDDAAQLIVAAIELSFDIVFGIFSENTHIQIGIASIKRRNVTIGHLLYGSTICQLLQQRGFFCTKQRIRK